MLKELANYLLGGIIGVTLTLIAQSLNQSDTKGDIICFDNSGTIIFQLRDVVTDYTSNGLLVKAPKGDITISHSVQCFIMRNE